MTSEPIIRESVTKGSPTKGLETRAVELPGFRAISLRYAIAVVSVAAGILLRLSLPPVGLSAPYFTLFPAVMLAAFFGGLGPGILATLISLAAALYFFIPPFHSFIPAKGQDTWAAGVFVLISIFIASLADALRRSRARSDARLRELTLAAAHRNRTDQALEDFRREAEHTRDLLQTTLSSIGEAVIATDSQGRITFLNAVAQNLTGWTQHDAAGKAVSTIFPVFDEKTRLPVENPIDRVLREGAVVNPASPSLLINREGREIPIEDNAAPILHDERGMLGAVLVFRDVTVIRQSERAMRKSEERLKIALDSGRIGVWDWDVIRDRIDWSDLMHDLHGLAPNTFNGGFEDLMRLVHPQDRPRMAETMQNALHDDTRFYAEFRIVKPDGGVQWLAKNALVFHNEEGQPVRMLGATTDITARRLAEDRLRDQWRIFDTALSNTPDFVYLFDLQGRFTYVNRALLALWQKSLEDAVGKNFFELDYPPELAARLQRQIQHVIETRQLVRDQTPFTSLTGETRHYEYIFVPLLSPDGVVEGVTGATRDITESSKAEDALRKSEERLNLALEGGGGIGTWDWDIPAERIYCNDQFARLYSVDPDVAAAGAPPAAFLQRIFPEDRASVTAKLRDAVEACGDFTEEYRVIQEDGSLRWVHAKGRCHPDETGRPFRFPGVIFDISDRKKAEEALQESQARLRAIYDGTYEHIGLLSPAGILLEANRASLTFVGDTREDVIGKPFWETHWFTSTPGAPFMVREGVARAAAGEFVRFEAAMQQSSGDTRTFDLSFHPVHNEHGEVILIVPEARDITERKRAEEDLKRSNEELKRVNRELEEFAYVASHDLQEPLRMINIYTQLIRREVGAESENLRSFASTVQQGVARMQLLIQDLLTFSQTVHAGHPPVGGTADLSASIKEALSVLGSRIEECGASVTVPPMPAVLGETAQFVHVFQNLISNALKYRRQDVPPQIRISAEEKASECIISVHDNGIGFAPEYAERIFGLFKRLHRDEYPGTGLGLAICKRIVERYGGRIWAESRPGQGSVFHLSLHRP